MGKKNIYKWLAVLGIGVVAMSTNALITRADTYTTPPIVIAESEHTQIIISNEKLNQALRSILGKSANDNFYTDDFITHEKFKPTTTTGAGGVETVTAQNYQLDLSRTGVTDIIELVQFEFPSTLQGINLAENGITNEHLTSITQFLNTNNVGEFITIGTDTTLAVKSDFSSIIKKVNLNGNNLDLTTISDTHLNNEKFIFGLQNIGQIHSSGLVYSNSDTREVNPYYYIRKNVDENYFTFNFKYELSTSSESKISIAYDKVTNLLDNLQTIYGNNTDFISLEIKSVPDSNTAYFKDYEYKREFTHFTLSIDDDFTVERNSLLNLKVSSTGTIEEDSPIIISGFGDNSGIRVSYENTSTNHITNENHKNFVHITIKKDSNERSIPVEFIVVDTVSPIIKLVGNQYAYSSQNKEYNDPGVIAYDPSTPTDDTGEDLTQKVVKTSNLDITTIGVYTITYTVEDLAHNSVSISRTVEIKERVLDRINLTVTSKELIDGADIVLNIKPDVGIDLSNYKDIKYYWYINNTLFQETVGDSATGASTITIIGDSSANQQIYVKMTAIQIADNATIELFSERLDLNVDKGLDKNKSMTLAAAIAVLVIILVFSGIGLHRYHKAKKNTHRKRSKNTSKLPEQQNNNSSIQVIKNYTGDNNTGGGHTNFRPPENDKNSPNKE